MINKLSFKNYKAFSEGEIKIKPITILLGANSVGKSSIMQLFLLLQQTALCEENYKSALKLYGGSVSLGEGLNLFRKKDKNSTLTISIDFSSKILFQELQTQYLQNYLEEVYYFTTLVERTYGKISDETSTFWKKFRDLFTNSNSRHSRFNRFSFVENLEVMDEDTFINLIENAFKLIEHIDIKDISKEVKDEYLYYAHRFTSNRSEVNYFQVLKERREEFFLAYNFLKGMANDTHDDQFKVSYDIILNEKFLVVKTVSLLNGRNEILTIEFENSVFKNTSPIAVKSKYIDSNQMVPRVFAGIKKYFHNQKTIFSFFDEHRHEAEEKPETIFGSVLKPLLTSFKKEISDFFKNDNINYVSPLRAHPKRYYFLDKARSNVYVDTLDGDAIAETLKDNLLLRNQVNSWLKKFNLKIEVDQLQDIIHKLVVNQNSLNLDITDVGFGISQVLPVIIQGFLSHNDSLTLIEQPEIHLHPKMQADLADLFIDITQAFSKPEFSRISKYLLIETHSEYLLKRLRRRIADGTISADDVGIYLIDPQTESDGAVINELKVKEKGEFDWPVDFYGGELLEDTIQFIRNQRKEA